MKIYGGTIFDIPSYLGYNNEENKDPNPFKLVVYLSEFVSGNRVHLDQGLPNNPNQIWSSIDRVRGPLTWTKFIRSGVVGQLPLLESDLSGVDGKCNSVPGIEGMALKGVFMLGVLGYPVSIIGQLNELDTLTSWVLN